jgi:cysteinyl-tRNA synthetase
MHNNLITINGQKMGKSLNNFITLEEFFTGNHEALDQAYSPMTIRFFMLQAHYRSTLDFSNESLMAAEKGMHKLLDAYHLLSRLKPSEKSTVEVTKFETLCQEAMNDDFNTPITLSHLFDLARLLNQVNDGKQSLTAGDIEKAREIFELYLFDILGIRDETSQDNASLVDSLMETILRIRQQAKDRKDYTTADQIRDELTKLNIEIKDSREGSSWEIN